MFYVYRHIRLDTNTVFYVGKGHGRRAWNKSKRSKYWKNIVNKHGYRVEIIIDGFTEREALDRETEFIKMYKDLGYCEANFTNGGEGVSGYKFTPEQRKRLSESHMGQKSWNKGKIGILSEETKKLISKKLKLYYKKHVSKNKGRVHSEKTKKKSSEAQKRRFKTQKHPRKGSKCSESTKLKISEANLGNIRTPEQRKRLSECQKQYYAKNRHHMKGKSLSNEVRNKVSKTMQDRGVAKGKNNSSWKGYLITPYGTFETITEATKVLKMSPNTIRKYLRTKNIEWFLSKQRGIL